MNTFIPNHGPRVFWRPALLVGTMSVLVATAQFVGRGGVSSNNLIDRSGVPSWGNQTGFEHDVFTFVRIRYAATALGGSGGRGGGRGSGWRNDYPNTDLNISFRLKQMTSMKTDPNGDVIELSDPKLFEYPFIDILAPARWEPDEAEARALRRYLLNGGFVMMDDFWGREAIENVLFQMNRVLPGMKPTELTLDHPIFNVVYKMSELPQVADIRTWRSGLSYELHGDMTDHAPHFLAFYDERGRMMALLCHNNDLSDGWEREGENPDFFAAFSERYSFPMAINILFYLMSH